MYSNTQLNSGWRLWLLLQTHRRHTIDIFFVFLALLSIVKGDLLHMFLSIFNLSFYPVHLHSERVTCSMLLRQIKWFYCLSISWMPAKSAWPASSFKTVSLKSCSFIHDASHSAQWLNSVHLFFRSVLSAYNQYAPPTFPLFKLACQRQSSDHHEPNWICVYWSSLFYGLAS